MKSRTTTQFRKAFAGLSEQAQKKTREAYRQFKQDPRHPSLRFKKVHPELPIYSARISKSYRAVGQLERRFTNHKILVQLSRGAGSGERGRAESVDFSLLNLSNCITESVF